MNYKDILSEKAVIVHGSLDVPINDQGRITDTSRVDQVVEFINEITEFASRIVVIGHLGRPAGFDSRYSLEPVKNYINSKTTRDTVLCSTIDAIDSVAPDKIAVLENIRFFPEEQSEDEESRKGFARELAKYGDVFVNNAFPSYRPTASNYELPKLLPGYIGPHFQAEMKALDTLKNNPSEPYVAILGGAKISTKIAFLQSLLEKADKVLIGGAMSYTFMKAKGMGIGNSMHEDDDIGTAKTLLKAYAHKLILPVDHLISDFFDKDSHYEYTESDHIPQDTIAIDIGWKTINLYKQYIQSAKTILWNGPMGIAEWEHSSVGTLEVTKEVSVSSAYTVVGGGESVNFLNQVNLKGFDHVSLGGGAMLAYLSKSTFPTRDVINGEKHQ